MVLLHLIYDLVELYPILNWEYPPLFSFLKNRGGTAFLLISGLSATLSRRSFRRGAVVFGCALAVTAVTRITGAAILFGVLHCLGLCMMLWPGLRRCSCPILCAIAAAAIGLGLWFEQVHVSQPYLFILGLTAPDFSSPDYFPLLPNLGFFLLGAAIGRTFYKDRQTLLPHWNDRNPVFRCLCFCGRHALPIYLIHQPLLIGAMELIL